MNVFVGVFGGRGKTLAEERGGTREEPAFL
jgi:hypothetical protein